jgi:hypothetical protein
VVLAERLGVGLMSTSEGYQGWSNHPTWAVNLWLSNDESSHEYWTQVAREILVDAETNASGEDSPDATGVRLEAARDLADRMRSELHEAAPDLGATVWADLLSSALDDVDWNEIATAWLEGLQ